jgi:hypothetical protein
MFAPGLINQVANNVVAMPVNPRQHFLVHDPFNSYVPLFVDKLFVIVRRSGRAVVSL